MTLLMKLAGPLCANIADKGSEKGECAMAPNGFDRISMNVSEKKLLPAEE
jgi:hypothetical protein